METATIDVVQEKASYIHELQLRAILPVLQLLNKLHDKPPEYILEKFKLTLYGEECIAFLTEDNAQQVLNYCEKWGLMTTKTRYEEILKRKGRR